MSRGDTPGEGSWWRVYTAANGAAAYTRSHRITRRPQNVGVASVVDVSVTPSLTSCDVMWRHFLDVARRHRLYWQSI